jgi:transcriptional regulator with XRE-family HTH domain
MQVYEKLKIMRLFKDLTQEEMAEKLGYSLNGYTKIERGETDITVGKLEKIAEAIGIDLSKLLGLNEGNIFNIAEHCHYNYGVKNVVFLTESECSQELEKAQLLLQEKDKQIESLQRENSHLQKIIALMETQPEN